MRTNPLIWLGLVLLCVVGVVLIATNRAPSPSAPGRVPESLPQGNLPHVEPLAVPLPVSTSTLTRPSVDAGTPPHLLLPSPALGDDRQIIDLNQDWKFIRSDVPTAEAPLCNESTWTSVVLPHTWNSQDGHSGKDTYYRGVGWYRRHLTVPATYANKEIFLTLAGACMISDIYVNGTHIGHHEGGFAAFTVRLTHVLHVGTDAVIAIKVTNAVARDVPPLYADFTFCGGLYRGASLTITDPVHISMMDFASPGVYLTQRQVSKESATVIATTKITNDGPTNERVQVHLSVVDTARKVVTDSAIEQEVPAGTTSSLVADLLLARPHLWDGVRDPYLYRVVITAAVGGRAVDHLEQPLGLRSFRMDPNQGFILNDHPWDLHGVAMHQDRWGKGWATSAADQEQDVSLLRELGATFVRLAHYQHPQHTYDLLDRCGIIAWTEIPCAMQVSLTPQFAANCRQQLQELIRQNYNHPSVVCWGLFNEIPRGDQVEAMVRDLVDCAHREDGTRPTTAASFQPDESPINQLTDVIGFNKYYGWYIPGMDKFAPWAQACHQQFPQRSIGISEYGVGGSPVDHEAHPVEPSFSVLSIKLRKHTEDYQAYFHERAWKQLASQPFLWCKSLWVLFDFASDRRTDGYLPGITDFGLITADRTIKKDAYYWYQANWSTAPVIYITSRRDTVRSDAHAEIKAYSNAQSVQLRFNGHDLPVMSSDDHIFRWPVTLQAGMNHIAARGSWPGQSAEDSITVMLSPDH